MKMDKNSKNCMRKKSLYMRERERDRKGISKKVKELRENRINIKNDGEAKCNKKANKKQKKKKKKKKRKSHQRTACKNDKFSIQGSHHFFSEIQFF